MIYCETSEEMSEEENDTFFRKSLDDNATISFLRAVRSFPASIYMIPQRLSHERFGRLAKNEFSA